MASLTMKRLRAVEEALLARLAGPIDSGIDRDIYERALDWAEAEIEKRKAAKP